jgi:hypothetical protein
MNAFRKTIFSMSKSYQQIAPHNAVMTALIIYDDFASAVKANATIEHAAYRADVAVRWNIIPWQLEVLRLLAAADLALREAVDAHLIVFAGRRAKAFPSWARHWLERWAAQRQVLDAAVAVVNGDNGVTRLSQRTCVLSNFAERHGLDFISNPMISIQTGAMFSVGELLMLKNQPGVGMAETGK